ncbi:SAM-dependent methyltransferase [Alteromonas stellipolaris]|uniref:methyltransferase n=1 Tax=Alteromonas stellipolaris TaxID=233316 RepID=UPI0007705D87|nr:methyltransferase [Alteromonas stellipolaris]AMJ94707.1 SAM-dependent methyltransferase [Alteromonas stellipolaris]
MTEKLDHIFDGIAAKFADNIYGTTKGKLRQIILCEALAPFVEVSENTQSKKVIEVGGGTGVMAAHLASLGHSILLTDGSEDVLEHAKENLKTFSNVDIQHQYLLDIQNMENYDLVVCHAVLEWLNDPYQAIQFLYDNMRKGAILSLSFFNRDANLMTNAIYGNFDYIAQGMKVRNQVRLNPKNPLPAKQASDFCESIGFTVKAKTGIRCFHDYLKNPEHQTTQFEGLLTLERTYNQTEPFMWLGKYFHLVLEK